MACHHHRSNCATTSCHCNHRCCDHPLPPQHQYPVDPLLQTLTSLLQQQPPPYYTHLNPHLHQQPHFKPKNLHFEIHDHDPQTISILSSLVRRITKLESSLNHFHSATSNSTLRDAAARVIQTHFRAFLVRRSRTLRELKELAFIKSAFNSLKSSVSSKTHFDSSIVSRKVTDLLLKLNSIQGGDPMIGDGKRSIGREMVSFLESIDGFLVKKAIVSKTAKKSNGKFVKSGHKCRNLRSKDDDVKEIVEKLRERVEKIEGFSRACGNDEEGVELEGFHQFVDHHDNEDGYGDSNGGNKRVSANVGHDVLEIPNGIYVRGHDVEPKVKKTVSFNDNGNVYTVYRETDESASNEDGSLTDEIDSSDDGGQGVEEFLVESEGIKRSSKLDEVKSKNRKDWTSIDDPGNKGYCWDQDGNLVFAAPVPVKMESRTDSAKKKKGVQIVT